MSARDLSFWVMEVGSIVAIATGCGVAFWLLLQNARGRAMRSRDPPAQVADELAGKLDHLISWLAWYGAAWVQDEHFRTRARSHVAHATAVVRATQAPDIPAGGLRAAWQMAQQLADEGWNRVEALHGQFGDGVEHTQDVHLQAIEAVVRMLRQSAATFRTAALELRSQPETK